MPALSLELRLATMRTLPQRLVSIVVVGTITFEPAFVAGSSGRCFGLIAASLLFPHRRSQPRRARLIAPAVPGNTACSRFRYNALTRFRPEAVATSMDDRKIIRIGLIGAGDVTRRVHLPGFRRCPGVEVAGCCDPIQEAAESLGLAVAESDPNGSWPGTTSTEWSWRSRTTFTGSCSGRVQGRQARPV